MVSTKICFLTGFVLVCTGLVSGGMGAGQGAGVNQQVSVEVDRSSDGVISGLRTYCQYYSLESCENGFGWSSIPGTLYHLFTVDDPDVWYEENRLNNGEGSSGSGQKVHHFS